ADEPATPPGEVAMRNCILVIDDDATARDLIADYLRQAGFSVITAAGGREGLRRAKEYHPIAITLDVIMPGIDGWTALAAVRGGATRRPGACRHSDRHGDDRRRAAAWHDAGGCWVSHEADRPREVGGSDCEIQSTFRTNPGLGRRG